MLIYGEKLLRLQWGLNSINSYLSNFLQPSLPLLPGHGPSLPIEAGREFESRGRHAPAQYCHAPSSDGGNTAQSTNCCSGNCSRSREQSHGRCRCLQSCVWWSSGSTWWRWWVDWHMGDWWWQVGWRYPRIWFQSVTVNHHLFCKKIQENS